MPRPATGKTRTWQVADAENRNLDPHDYLVASAAADQTVKVAQAKAIAFYTIIKERYPGYSKLDEVLYYLAYEYERAQNYDKAREGYLELITKVPKSPYVPSAYLAIGEFFFRQALSDGSKWDLAAAAYKKAINYPPPGNAMYGYARYKLAYVYWNKSDQAKALSELKKVIEYSMTFGDLPNAKHLGTLARNTMPAIYAEAGRPDKAFDFFRPLSGDIPGSTEKTLVLLLELGNAFQVHGKAKETVETYLQVTKRTKVGDPRACDELARPFWGQSRGNSGLF